MKRKARNEEHTRKNRNNQEERIPLFLSFVKKKHKQHNVKQNSTMFTRER